MAHRRKKVKILRTGGYEQGSSAKNMKEAEKDVKEILKYDWVKYVGIYRKGDLGWGGTGKYVIAYSDKPFLSEPLKLFKKVKK